MPIDIPDLWSDDIKVDVLPPLVILKAQDDAIRKKTQGILHTEISTSHELEPDQIHFWVTHALELVAPAIGYRESVLNVSYREGKLYPATIEMPERIEWADGTASATVRCFDPDEFIAELRVALRSPPTKGAIATMLALSNEARLKNG